jgi:NitT/TauT family transport system substrate-binding protein
MSNSTQPRRARTLRRPLALLSVSLLAAALLSACGESSEAETGGLTAFSGVNGDPTNGPSGAPFGSVQIAEGWDERDGYQLKWDVAQSATAGLQLLANGSVDIAQGATPNGYAATHLDDNLRIVAFLNGPNYLITVPEDSDIQDAADLKGKTLGVMTLGSSSHLMAQGAVKAAGLSPDDVKYLPVSIGAPMAEALNSGKIDALVGWEGMWQSISDITDVPLKRLETRLSEIYGQMLLVTTTDVIENERETLKAYLRNFYRACALSANEPERAVENHWEVFSNVAPPAAERDAAVKEYAGWNKDFFSTCIEPSPETGEIGSLSDAELKETYEFFLDNGIIEDEVDITEVVDQSIVREALEDVDVQDYDS